MEISPRQPNPTNEEFSFLIRLTGGQVVVWIKDIELSMGDRVTKRERLSRRGLHCVGGGPDGGFCRAIDVTKAPGIGGGERKEEGE